jgi:erythromycin esterase-like protein
VEDFMFDFQEDIIGNVRSSALLVNHAVRSTLTPVIDLIKNKSFILLGEATHGTREFYEARIEITKRLIIDHGLNAIAIEGDWPSAYRVNRYVRGLGNDTNANEALSSFKRFPLWMWRNTVTLDFIQWLRHHNQGLPAAQRVGFYGLDMYSMYESISAVLEYLDQVDPAAAKEARENYACLDHTDNAQIYGFGVKVKQRPSCENEVVEQLIALRNKSFVYAKPGDDSSEEDQFQAEQNAYLIKSAENYYRQMFTNRTDVWNLRDNHMIDTLDNLHRHLLKHSKKLTKIKIAVWEHNSHLGDARATYMYDIAQHNVGQLARERYGDDCVLIGFTTYSGTVTAASEWDSPAKCKKIRPALTNSIEEIFHKTGLKNFYLRLTDPTNEKIEKLFNKKKEQRAIGVIYRPETERASHYFSCQLAYQFDAIIHYDETNALEPLDPTSEWTHGEESTFPFGT